MNLLWLSNSSGHFCNDTGINREVCIWLWQELTIFVEYWVKLVRRIPVDTALQGRSTNGQQQCPRAPSSLFVHNCFQLIIIIPLQIKLNDVDYLPEIITLKPSKTQGRYIALNWVPNQKLTIVSLFNWHQTYRTLRTIGSIKYCKDKI